jgi:hypothetical protein
MQALTIDTLTPTSAILSGWSVDVEAGGGADIETQVVIAAATDTLAGLMPAADHVQIAQLSADVLALQQQGGKYIGRSFPTAAALAAYVFAATDNPGDFTYVSDDEAHAGATTRYVIGGEKSPTDTRAWEFAYILERDPIGTATTAALGLVKGSNTSGQVYVETNGTMSLVGYDALKSAINAQVPVVTATNTALGIVKGSTAYGEISISAAGVMTAVGLRKRLTAATTFSIRTSADGGNDTNDGRSAAGAMLTFNNLVTRLVQEYDLNRQTVTINIGAGTWTNQAWRLDTDKLTNFGTIVIQGAGVDATILSASNGTTTSRNGLLIYGPPSAYQIQVKDMQFTNCGSCLGFYYGAYGRLGNLKFGPHFANKSGYDVISDLGSWVTTLGASGSLINLTHTSGAGNAASYPYYAGDRATMRLDYCNVAIDPAVTANGFVNIMNGEFEIYAAARTVFSGTLTGKRANITRKGKLYTALRGEAALPGTVASTVDYTGCVIDSPRPARKYQKLTAALAANATWATPAYIVGSGALQIYLGGVIAPAGTSASNGFYQEVGNAGASSTSIKIFEALPIGASLTAVVAA